MKLSSEDFAQTSPLYNYWHSPQDNLEEKSRLNMANNTHKAVSLFKNEPYKWETLFQGVIREINDGNENYLFALSILIETLVSEEKEKIIRLLKRKQIISNQSENLLLNNKINPPKNKTTIYKPMSFLLSIFTNPYNLEVKRRKKHIYEITGGFMLSIKSFIC